MSIDLFSRMPPPNSVGTAQLQDGAVTTTKIADGAVTTAKVADSLRTAFILGDNTMVTGTSTTYTAVKVFNLYKDTTVDIMNWSEIDATVELMSSASSVTAYVGFFVDSESSPRLELYTNSTSYSVLKGSFSISDLTTGLHTITISLKVSASGTATQRHVEILAKR